MPSETYEFLERLSNGDYSEIYSYNYPDELIGGINKSSKNPRSTQITIEFDNYEKYLNILGIDNEEDIWIWNRFIGARDYYNDYSWDRYRDDFFEGYIFDSLNQENLRLISKIRNLTPVPTKEQDTQRKLEKYLHTKFYSEIDDIIGIYQTYNDDCVARAVKDILINETKNPFQKFGIVEIYPHYKFKTTVGILLNLYKMMNSQELDLSGLLKEIDQKYNKSYHSRGDWYELEYNSWCDDFDSLGMNNEIKIELEKIIEQIEESVGDEEDLKNYNELFDAVFKLGGFEKWINLPQKQTVAVVNFKELKTNPTRLKFLYNKSNGGMEYRSVKNLEELNMMLYQGELFENVKKTLRKLL